MYTLPHAVRLKDHLLERWEAADRDPSLVEDGALNIVVVGGGPTGVETAGALAELYRGDFAKDYPDLPQDQARVILVEAGPELFSMFKPKLREYAAKALAERTVEVMTGALVASVSPTRVTLKSGEELKAHTLVWGAGLQGNRLVQTLGLELQRGNRIGVGPDLTLPDHPEVYVARRRRRDRRREDRAGPAAARLGRAPVRRARRRDDRAPRSPARRRSRSSTSDKGTMATIGRGAAVVQMLGGRTMTGKKAQAAWGAVHLALLPTNEDRAKAVVDWAGSRVDAPARRPDHRGRRVERRLARGKRHDASARLSSARC